MGRAKALLFSCFMATLVQNAPAPAQVADILPPAPPLEEPSLRGALAEDSGFYLRLDGGVANTNATKPRSIYGDLGAAAPLATRASIGDPFILGLGMGYQFNTWLRADLTGEYRQGVHYHASSTAQFVGAAALPHRRVRLLRRRCLRHGEDGTFPRQRLYRHRQLVWRHALCRRRRRRGRLADLGADGQGALRRRRLRLRAQCERRQFRMVADGWRVLPFVAQSRWST